MSEIIPAQPAFEENVKGVLRLLGSAQELLNRDVAPDAELRREISDTLDMLGRQYEEIRNSAEALGITDEGMPFSWYASAIESATNRQVLKEILDTLERFLTIGTDIPHLDSELDPFRLAARQKALEAMEADSAIPSDELDPEATLLRAVGMPKEQLLSQEGLTVVRRLEELFPATNVSYGVSFGAYREGYYPRVNLQDGAIPMSVGGITSVEESRQSDRADVATSVGDKVERTQTLPSVQGGGEAIPHSEGMSSEEDHPAKGGALPDIEGERPEACDHHEDDGGLAIDVATVNEPSIDEPSIDEPTPVSEVQTTCYESLVQPVSSLAKKASAKGFYHDVCKMSGPARGTLMLLSRFGALAIEQVRSMFAILPWEDLKELDDDSLFSSLDQLFRMGYATAFETPRGKVIGLTQFARSNLRKQSVRDYDPKMFTLFALGVQAIAPVFGSTVDARTLDTLLARVDVLLEAFTKQLEGLGFHDVEAAFMYTVCSLDCLLTADKAPNSERFFIYATVPADAEKVEENGIAVTTDKHLGQELIEALGEECVLAIGWGDTQISDSAETSEIPYAQPTGVTHSAPPAIGSEEAEAPDNVGRENASAGPETNRSVGADETDGDVESGGESALERAIDAIETHADDSLEPFDVPEPSSNDSDSSLIMRETAGPDRCVPAEQEPTEIASCPIPNLPAEQAPVQPLTFHDILMMDRPSDEETVKLCENMLQGLSIEAPVEVRVGIAITFAQAASLSSSGEETRRLFRKLVLATDADLDDHGYSLDEIRDAFPEADTSSLGQALLLATYLRAMLDPEKPFDYSLWDAFDYYAENYDDFFGAFPDIKPLFIEMRGIHDVSQQHGFTPTVIGRLGERERNKDHLQEICEEARQLIPVRKVKNQIQGIHEFHEAAFGEGSELGRAMAAIANDDDTALEAVTRLAHRFAGEDLLASKYDLSAVEADITKTWREQVLPEVITHKHKGNKDLGFDARRTARDEYGKRIKAMCAWVSYKESHSSDEVLRGLGRKRSAILAESERALASLSSSTTCGGGEFLSATIKDITKRLSGETDEIAVYTDFLRTGLISLSDDSRPMISEMEGRIAHFEPWRRVLLHAQERDISLQEALERTEEKGCYSYDNLRQATQIRDLLGMQQPDKRSQQEAQTCAANDARRRLASFKSELEIWFAYGRIDDDQRETLATTAEDMCAPLFETGNFGLWYLLLDALTATADEWAAVQYDELHERYDAALTRVAEDGGSQLLEAARQLLEDERNYAVVEDYLNRFDAGERILMRRDSDGEEDAFASFMSDEVFQPLYDLAVGAKDSTARFKTMVKRVVSERRSNNWTQEQINDAHDLIMNWPSNRRYDTTQLRDLFVGMGFAATHGEKIKASDTKVEHYRIHLRPTARNLQSYDHPIAAFGTQSVESVDVVVAYENTSAQTVVQLVSSLGANEAVAVLVDYHLDRPTRRQVAERYMRMSSRPTKFLLIDRVLLMHLALAEKPARLSLLLKCTLPLTYLQPFGDGSGATADEMFSGRVTELEAVKDFNGRCILYGGRQLGKTALLERAASLVNDPQKRIFAVKVKIKDMTDESVVVKQIMQDLNRELRRSKKSLKLAGCESISELCLKLDELFEEGEIVRLLLMIDETDSFLSAISKNGYSELEPLDDLLRNRAGYFKFVLAGLHNVVRATRSKSKNGIFGRLGEPICIKPLPPRDALRLLSRPLIYLGYHVDYPNVETILTNTNYYPGLVQFFGNKLVESMSNHFGVYYAAARNNPPYPLGEGQLAGIFSDYDINNAIREKFMLTLELDERDRYMLIAQIIAALYYDRKNEGRPTNEGFTAREIKTFADEYSFEKLSLETPHTFLSLLDEMCEMGVLTHVGPARDHYRIRRSTFLGYIGSEEDVWNALEEELNEQ